MIKTVLGYDIEPGVTAEEYEQWLFEVHVPDILANPHIERVVFNLVLRDVTRSSDGSTPIEGQTFYRVAEMHFADEAAYERYLAWFEDHPIPIERSPKGRTAFRFYVLTSVTEVDRSGPLPPSFLDLEAGT